MTPSSHVRYCRVVDALASCALPNSAPHPLYSNAPVKAELCSRLMFGGGFDRARAAVIGDRLLGAGDPVGFWIALALAADSEQDPEKRREIEPWPGDWTGEGLAYPTCSPVGALEPLPGVYWTTPHRILTYYPALDVLDGARTVPSWTPTPLEVTAGSEGSGCPFFAWLAVASLVRKPALISLAHSKRETEYTIHGRLGKDFLCQVFPYITNVETSYCHGRI